MVKISGPGKRLAIYIGESDRYEGKPLYQAIVRTLKREGLAGVTVLRGLEGFGAHSRIHSTQLLRLSSDLPIVIVVVDSEKYINKALPVLDNMVQEGLMTLEDVEVIKYRPRNHEPERENA